MRKDNLVRDDPTIETWNIGFILTLGAVHITTGQQISKHEHRHSNNSSRVHLALPNVKTYAFERYVPRSLLNTLGPCLFTLLYLFIIEIYLRRSSVNDIVPNYPLDAKTVFYAWLVLSVFVLDWAKSGLGGFEAAALMKPIFAPGTALQLMWHADRGWASLSGWWKASLALFHHSRQGISKRRKGGPAVYRGPAILWWYLSLSSFLFFVAVPLAGLSMDPKSALRTSSRKILIQGPNQTSFDISSSNPLAERASNRWRQGNPTTPQGDTILYAPQGTSNVTDCYLNDAAQAIYDADNVGKIVSTGPLSFFSGPQVSERAHGRVWGLLTNLTCSVAHPYRDLQLLNVTGIANWSAPIAATSSTFYDSAIQSKNIQIAQSGGGTSPGLFYDGDNSFGVDYKYLIGSDRNIEGGSDYTNASRLPLNGSLELVLWQGYRSPFQADAIFQNMSSHPSVVSSIWPYDNSSYLGYGIRCRMNSTVGYAHIDASKRVYSNFSQDAAVTFGISVNLTSAGASISIPNYPGVLAIQSIVYSAFTSAILAYYAPPVCSTGGSTTCNAWYGANIATQGTPQFISDIGGSKGKHLQYPTLSPERMKLAMYKLFGEAAISMMASGPAVFKGNLSGLDPANDLIPGVVPWQLVLTLLGMWTVITVLPNCWTLFQRRWAAILDGFEMFRLGAEWRGAVLQLEEREFIDCDALRDVPGMVGDMESESVRGFVGLSSTVAKAQDRMYVHDRKGLVTS
ncbi:MAG: hypothetical protein Q9220_003044 [cf. Caloplaca sp. 1 TL-2023]